MPREGRHGGPQRLPSGRTEGPPVLLPLPLPDRRVTPENARDYLALPNVGCVGGSWLTPKDAVAQGDWARIESLAAQAASLRSA